MTLELKNLYPQTKRGNVSYNVNVAYATIEVYVMDKTQAKKAEDALDAVMLEFNKVYDALEQIEKALESKEPFQLAAAYKLAREVLND